MNNNYYIITKYYILMNKNYCRSGSTEFARVEYTIPEKQPSYKVSHYFRFHHYLCLCLCLITPCPTFRDSKPQFGMTMTVL